MQADVTVDDAESISSTRREILAQFPSEVRALSMLSINRPSASDWNALCAEYLRCEDTQEAELASFVRAAFNLERETISHRRERLLSRARRAEAQAGPTVPSAVCVKCAALLGRGAEGIYHNAGWLESCGRTVYEQRNSGSTAQHRLFYDSVDSLWTIARCDEFLKLDGSACAYLATNEETWSPARDIEEPAYGRASLGSRIWGQKMGSKGTELAESERGAWLSWKRYAVSVLPVSIESASSCFSGGGKPMLPPNSGAQVRVSTPNRARRATRRTTRVTRMTQRLTFSGTFTTSRLGRGAGTVILKSVPRGIHPCLRGLMRAQKPSTSSLSSSTIASRPVLLLFCTRITTC